MAKEKICGIYKIENKINRKIYIGQSTNIKQRFYDHKSRLRNNKHKNDLLQNSWNKYGECNFIFEVIEKCDIDILDEKERYWISFYKSNNKDYGFNFDCGGNLNKQLSKETKLRISKNHMNVNGENNPFYGKTHSSDTLNKIINSEGYKNRKVRGEDSYRANLTEEQVIQIKHKLIDGESTTKLAKEYGVGLSTINHIKFNRSWKHIVV